MCLWRQAAALLTTRVLSNPQWINLAHVSNNGRVLTMNQKEKRNKKKRNKGGKTKKNPLV